MNKADLIEEVSEQLGITKKDVERVLNTTIDAIIARVSAGEKVVLVDFCQIQRKTRKARRGRNPRTGQEIDIPESTVPVFTPGKFFKESVSK